MKGFTLVEILLVVGIIGILTVLFVPMGLDFYRTQQLDISSEALAQSIRRVQLKSMSAELDSKFGIYITNDNYILFKGDSYLERDAQYDETFDLPDIVTLAGSPREIIFSKFEGRPSFVGSIVLNSGGASRTIIINKFGTVNLE